MAHKTQCPKCFTIYVITDKQYERSKGKVRCGTCRERFEASVYPEPQSPFFESVTSQSQTFTEYEHPETNQSGNSLSENLVSSKQIDQDTQEVKNQSTGESHDEESSVVSYDYGLNSRLHSELSIVTDYNEPVFIDQDNPQHNSSQTGAIDTKEDDRNSATLLGDQSLISVVDQLVDDKILGDAIEPPTAQSSDSNLNELNEKLKEDQTFTLNEKAPVFHRWLLKPLLSLLILILLATLVYQLWHRQAFTQLENTQLYDRLEPVLSPFAKPIVGLLSEHLDVTLPIRRDLNQLQLISARTEAHPTRSSTILLRVSIVNHSEIAQPFPWLELILTDENGRLVARRPLAPESYLHNNRLENSIAPKELRPVTIEFLSFPNQAHGYELRLLNN